MLMEQKFMIAGVILTIILICVAVYYATRPRSSSSSTSSSPSSSAKKNGIATIINSSISTGTLKQQAAKVSVSGTADEVINNYNANVPKTNKNKSSFVLERTKSNFPNSNFNLLSLYEFQKLDPKILALYTNNILPIMQAFFSKMTGPVSQDTLQYVYLNAQAGLGIDPIDLNPLIAKQVTHLSPADYSKTVPDNAITFIDLDEFSTLPPNFKKAYRTNVCRLWDFVAQAFVVTGAPQDTLTPLRDLIISKINSDMNTTDINLLSIGSPSISSIKIPTVTFNNTIMDFAEFSSLDPTIIDMYKRCVVPAIRAYCTTVIDLNSTSMSILNSLTETQPLNTIDLGPAISNLH